MSTPSSRCLSRLGALGALAAGCLAPTPVHAQACCAGGSVITPARLQIHEDALVGFDAKLASVTGSFDTGSRYIPSPGGDTELDLEQDLFGAVRFLRRGQAALLVPAVETRRATPQLGAQTGAGVGDINASARWDFVLARESWIVPGIAVLAGVTAPSGKAPDAATPPLFSDATGIGAWQLQAALALEQTWGPWLANLTGIAAKRTEHGGETLGTQFTLLAAGAYTFPNEMAVGLAVSYATEGNAACSSAGSGLCSAGSTTVPDSAKSVTTVSLSGLFPLGDAWRVLGGLNATPMLNGFGANQPASAGLTVGVVRSWS